LVVDVRVTMIATAALPRELGMDRRAADAL
jgi:hypothetical protein